MRRTSTPTPTPTQAVSFGAAYVVEVGVCFVATFDLGCDGSLSRRCSALLAFTQATSLGQKFVCYGDDVFILSWVASVAGSVDPWP